MADFDFGFTLVDEAELDSAKEVASSSASATAAQDRLDNLYNAILTTDLSKVLARSTPAIS